MRIHKAFSMLSLVLAVGCVALASADMDSDDTLHQMAVTGCSAQTYQRFVLPVTQAIDAGVALDAMIAAQQDHDKTQNVDARLSDAKIKALRALHALDDSPEKKDAADEALADIVAVCADMIVERQKLQRQKIRV